VKILILSIYLKHIIIVDYKYYWLNIYLFTICLGAKPSNIFGYKADSNIISSYSMAFKMEIPSGRMILCAIGIIKSLAGVILQRESLIIIAKLKSIIRGCGMIVSWYDGMMV
jgi:hypothetical protein